MNKNTISYLYKLRCTKNVMAGIFEWRVTFSVYGFTIIKLKYWLILSC